MDTKYLDLFLNMVLVFISKESINIFVSNDLGSDLSTTIKIIPLTCDLQAQSEQIDHAPSTLIKGTDKNKEFVI